MSVIEIRKDSVGVAFSIGAWCCDVNGFAVLTRSVAVLTRSVASSNANPFLSVFASLSASVSSTCFSVWCDYRAWSDCVSAAVCYAFCFSPSFPFATPIGCVIWFGADFCFDGDAIVIATGSVTQSRRRSHSHLLGNI